MPRETEIRIIHGCTGSVIQLDTRKAQCRQTTLISPRCLLLNRQMIGYIKKKHHNFGIVIFYSLAVCVILKRRDKSLKRTASLWRSQCFYCLKPCDVSCFLWGKTSSVLPRSCDPAALVQRMFVHTVLTVLQNDSCRNDLQPYLQPSFGKRELDET